MRGRVAFEDRATSGESLNAAFGDVFPVVEDIPFADPEIELPVVGTRVAERRRVEVRIFRRCLRMDEARATDQQGDEGAG